MRGTGFVRVLALAAAATVAACAPLQVNTYSRFDDHAALYRTYEWQAPLARRVGDARLDGESVFAGYVTAAVDERLRKHGLEPAPAGTADVVVRWSAATAQRTFVADRAAADRCEDCGIDLFDEGVLVIELVDPGTNQMLWRGWARCAIDGLVADQERVERRIDEAVARILAELPRSVGGRT